VKRPWLSRAWPRELDDFEDEERDEELLRDAMMLLLWSGCGTCGDAGAVTPNLGAVRARDVGAPCAWL
jgi:hypothetical protein